jgi:predicted XRE-type DNA-binding protein
MDRALLAMLLVIVVLIILAIGFNWINNNFNHYPEELDDLADEPLVKLKIKKCLLHALQQWINETSLTKEQIGEKLAVNRKMVANVIYQRVDTFTIDTLVNLVQRTGKTVSVSIDNQQVI